ncbi:MAG: DegT/DnrJ/EryC1/StrS family aminotransferase, partial [Thermoplasmata archaeon]|nr:DegT/DnrJ/EryC1/StrS family aminotransferase [Thermoplasmata archaeon]
LPDYTSSYPGLNARMSEVHGVVGLVQMKDIDTFVTNRNSYVTKFKEGLSDINGIKFQVIPDGHKSAHKDFSIVVDPDDFGETRDELGRALEEQGVGVKKYFYPPMHKLEAYRDLDAKLPMTEYVSNNILSLPIYNYMDDEAIKFICDSIRGIQSG